MATNSTLESVYRRAETVVRREIAGETFLVPVSGDLAHLQRIFVLNDVAAHVWDRLDGSCDLETLLKSVIADFEVEEGVARADLLELIDELLRAGLVLAGSGASGTGA